MSEGKSSDYMPSEVYIERYRYRYLDINISHYWENMIPNRIIYPFQFYSVYHYSKFHLFLQKRQRISCLWPWNSDSHLSICQKIHDWKKYIKCHHNFLQWLCWIQITRNAYFRSISFLGQIVWIDYHLWRWWGEKKYLVEMKVLHGFWVYLVLIPFQLNLHIPMSFIAMVTGYSF